MISSGMISKLKERWVVLMCWECLHYCRFICLLAGKEGCSTLPQLYFLRQMPVETLMATYLSTSLLQPFLSDSAAPTLLDVPIPAGKNLLGFEIHGHRAWLLIVLGFFFLYPQHLTRCLAPYQHLN